MRLRKQKNWGHIWVIKKKIEDGKEEVRFPGNFSEVELSLSRSAPTTADVCFPKQGLMRREGPRARVG